MPSVLVVDDDRLNQKMLTQVCLELDLNVRTAGDGVEALEQLRAEPADLMLLDLTMPRLDGLGVLRELQSVAETQRPAVVIVTGDTEIEGKIQGLELGAVDFIEKPFRHQDLLRRLGRVLGLLEMEQRIAAEEAKLAELRATDSVTGSGTFGELHRVLDAAFYYSQTVHDELSCVAVSDDGYDRTLEDGGRDAGEQRLKAISQAIQEKLRQGDRMFRLDMAEFVILLPSTTADGARVVVDKIREATGHLDGVDSSELAIAAATYPHDDIEQASQLFRATTLTLAHARSQSIGRVGFFSGFSSA